MGAEQKMDDGGPKLVAENTGLSAQNIGKSLDRKSVV